MGKPTPEQLSNLRRALSLILGPYAFVMSDEDVQRMRDKMQGQLNTWEDEEGEEP